jgi:hypothetical protein
MILSVADVDKKKRTPPDFDGLIFRCDHCRDYEVSGTALGQLEKLDLLERIDVLRKAQQ